MIIINNKKFSGNNLTISGNKVIIDGKDVSGEFQNDKVININCEGDVSSIDCDTCETITVAGKVGSVKTMSGTVKCQDVVGNVSTMSGDVRCGNIGGNVSTMSGDITHK